jgi:hypothetical protein
MNRQYCNIITTTTALSAVCPCSPTLEKAEVGGWEGGEGESNNEVGNCSSKEDRQMVPMGG